MQSKNLLRVGFTLLLFLFTSISLASGQQVLHGHVPPVLSHLQSSGAFPATNRLNLAISLPLRNQAQLSDLLNQIYDPESPNYHHYLKPGEFAESFGPTEQDYQAVIDFAKANGLRVTATYSNRLLVDVNGSVGNIERALHVSLNVYRHPTENRNFYAPTAEPSLDLSVPVLHISGLDNYELPRPRLMANRIASSQLASPNSGSGPGGTYSGKDFRAAYVPDSKMNGSGQSLGLLEFDGYSASDINYYENAASLPNVPLQNVLIDGATAGPENSGADIEVALDIEVAISMATNLSQLIVYQAPGGAPFEDILNQMAANDNVSQFSCSWYIQGGTEQPAADEIWIQMAAQGQSFFNASGDGDAWTGLIYFPGDSPYITQVGGTTLTTSGPGGSWVSETVWNWGNELGPQYNGVGSGGGVSTQYQIPAWQTNINMTANQGSTTMRNTPDVAMTADNIYVRVDGDNYSVGGTSCAAPLWAGFAALVNQQAVGSGHSPIGLINSAVDAIGTGAKYTSTFHDITTGNNTWSSSPSKFYAVSGYDLCTGWGTPAGQALINALANPEALIITPQNGFVSMGGAGGPFTITSEELSLTNAGTNSLTWSLSNTSAWLSVSSTGGTLAPDGATAVTVSLNTTASNLVVGTYSATLWFTNLNDGFGQGRQFTLDIISPPTITTQPTNEAVIEGTAATFTVSATGGLPLSYQWQFNGTNLTDGGNISGSLSTNLTVSNVSAADVGNYDVIVTNLAGVAVSSNAVLSITPSAPVIIMQPASQAAIVGQTVVFNVGVIGTTPFSYQWSFDGTNINDATNSSLPLADVQLVQAGIYAVEITNGLGTAISSNATLSVYAIPSITSFSPITGAAGTVVNIYGLNFSPVATNNVVYFGAEPAVVSSASATNLVVTVPVSATYAPITETVNGLTAYADTPFLTTFPGGQALSSASFTNSFNLGAGSGPVRVIAADIDGDGKPDLIVANDYEDDVYIYRNISTNDTLTTNSFAPPVKLIVGPTVSGTDAIYGLAVGDLAGDGRLDIAVADRYTGNVSVFQNLCTPGVITSNSFGARVDISIGLQPASLAIADIDGDGRPDIIVANNQSNSISIIRNTGVAGTLLTSNSFAVPVNFSSGVDSIAVAVGDIDGDGKPDVVIGNTASSGTANTLVILRNVSTPGNIALAAPVNFAGLGQVNGVAIGDLDGDGKPDVTMTSAQSGQAIMVYRNISTPGSITTSSLAAAANFGTGGWGNSVAISDLDGDGKPDIATQTQEPDHISLFRNTSTPGSFTNSSLGTRIDLPSGSNPNGMAPADLTGDGRPDLIFANFYNGTLSIAQNVTPFGGPPVITSEPASLNAIAGSNAMFSVTASGTTPLSYQWYFNETNQIGSATNSILTLTNIQAAAVGSYAVIITNVYGSVTSSAATLTIVFTPTITNEPVSITNLAGTTATFSVTAGGTTPLSYQWQFNGTNLTDGGNVSGSATTALTLTNVSSSEMGNYTVVVTNNYGSITSSVATLTVLFGPAITSQPVSVTNAAGATVAFSITASGTTPLNYQWQKNGMVLTNGGNVSGSTTAILTLMDISSNDAAVYNVLVTNAYGSALSSNATLTVILPSTNIPIITSFSPITGAAGTVVNIYGLNFSSIASSNVVYFGAEPAVVSSASATNLVVTVPVSATYAPITETVNGLTAYADTPFLTTFPGGQALSSASFTNSFNLGAGSGPVRVIAADIDGDGKPDLIVANDYEDDVYIYRNISTNDTLTTNSFAPPVKLIVGPTVSGTDAIYSLAVGDLAGDGRLDIAVADRYTGNVSVFQNLCTPGVITSTSFGARVDISISLQPASLAIADIDGDGRPDIIVANNQSNSISIIRNTGVAGTLLTSNSFAVPVNFSSGVDSIAVAVGDIDGDGKPDVVIGNTASSGTANTLVILRNVSTPGNIALAAPVNFAGLGQVNGVAIGDLDGDGKPDVTMTSAQSGQAIMVYRNISTPGSITTSSLAAAANFGTGGWGNSVAISDLDGDGKPDIATQTQEPNHVSLFRNTSTPGSFTNSSLGTRIDLPSGSNPNGMAPADLTGDGRPDLIFANFYNGTLSIAQNVTPIRPIITQQPTNETVIAGGTAIFSVMAESTLPLGYKWNFSGTNLPGATNATLILTNVQLANAGVYYVTVTNAYASIASSNAVLTVLVAPAITVQPTNQTVSAANNAAFGITASGTPPLSYQWIFNGSNSIPQATNSSLLLTNVQFANEGTYSVLVTNLYGSAISSNAVLVVTVDHFVWNTIASPRFVNSPFAVEIVAQDAANGAFTNYAGTVFLGSTNGLAVSPLVSSNFVQGIWTGTLVVSQTATNLVLTASDGSGHNGLANPINVVSLPLLSSILSGGTLYISWPTSPTGFVLETSTNLVLGNWSPVTAPPLSFGGQYVEPISPTGTNVNAFYRLYFTGQ